MPVEEFSSRKRSIRGKFFRIEGEIPAMKNRL